MNEKRRRELAFAERGKKLEEYLKNYQIALRALRNQIPQDGQATPHRVAAAIGRCDIWPCKDAAVVLTYSDDSAEVKIKLKDPLNKTVGEFMKQGEAFAYFDENGERVPMRLSFGPLEEDDPAYDSRIPPDDFSLRRFDFSDVVARAEEGDSSVPSNARKFFKPKFQRVSIFGWNTSLRNPNREAMKDFRKAYVTANLLGTGAEELIGREKTQKLMEVTDERIAEFEAALDDTDPDEGVKGFLRQHPELICPGYLRCYTNVALGDGHVADFLFLVREEEAEMEYIFVKLEGVNSNFFNGPGQLSEVFAFAKEEISAWEEWLTQNPTAITPEISDLSRVRFHLIMGRNISLSYLQRKELRVENSGTTRKFSSYDDLVNHLRFEVNDVAEIRDRFVSIDARLKKFNINTDEDFNRVMEVIDQEMRDESIPLTARSMEGGLRFSSGFRLNLMGRDPLTLKIHQWFSDRYGDRMKIDMDLGAMGVLLRGDLFRMRFPGSYGLMRFICSRDLTEEMPSVIVGTHDNPPTLNVLDFVEGLTQDYARSLTDEEMEALFNQFVFGRNAFLPIYEVSRAGLTEQARADLQASTSHLFTHPPNYGLSKWASLQAAEKFIKAYITAKGGSPPHHHRLRELAAIAESRSLPRIPQDWLDDIQCSAEVRYGGIPVTAQEAIDAQYATLQVCEHIAEAL